MSGYITARKKHEKRRRFTQDLDDATCHVLDVIAAQRSTDRKALIRDVIIPEWLNKLPGNKP